MEKKNFILVLGFAIAVPALIACVAVAIYFDRSSNARQHEQSAAQDQIANMTEALKKQMETLQSQMAELQSSMAKAQPLEMKGQQEALKKLQEQMDSMVKKLAEAQEEAMNKQMAALNSQMAAFESSIAKGQPPGQVTTRTDQFQVHPGQTVERHPRLNEAPAADSVEGKLRAEGKTWERAPGQPSVGDYVEDTMLDRMNQPKGRGNIGKVMSIAIDNGASCATVDFGRGCVEGILFSELAPIRFVAPEMR